MSIKVDPRRRSDWEIVRSPAPADAGATRERILEAAFRKLATAGYAALSVREIAKDAGVNHALINYYFGSKEQLVVEVFEAADQQRLQRQKAMYQGEGGFAHKWRQARRYYDADLQSGYVRVLVELVVASFADPRLWALFAPRLGRWKGVIERLTQPALDAAAGSGVAMPKGLTAEVAATLIQSFWLGMELSDLFGKPEDRASHERALDVIEALFDELDARTGARAATGPLAAESGAGQGGKNEQAVSRVVPSDRGPAARPGPPARRAPTAVRQRRTRA